jgi:hypothetical protein
VARRGIGGSDKDTIWVEEIVDCCACSEKFGVGQDFECEIWSVDFELDRED